MGKRLWRTNDPRWRRLRERVLSECPLCVECQRRGLIVAATDVDHIAGKAATAHDNRRANLQALCHACHSRKTASEDGGFGRDKLPPKGCDALGNPLAGWKA